MKEPSAPSGVGAYAELAKEALEAQEKRKASFEQRGIAVITTSGALVTLLFGLAALSTKRSATFVLPDPAREWLTVALYLFVAAAVAALVTNFPIAYTAMTAAGLKGRLKESPIRRLDDATKDVALTRVKELESAKRKNSFKGAMLMVAMALEVLAVACVARAIALIL